MGHFQVLFSGEVVDGANPDVVRQNLARELVVDERKLEQMFSGRTVVLKSQLAQHEAEAFQAKLANLGALIRIKDSAPKEKESPFVVDGKDRDSGDGDRTLQDLTAAHITCPRCGHMQLDAEFCTRCGIDIRATLKQQRKEDLIIEKKIRELRAKQGQATTAKPVVKKPVTSSYEDELKTENRPKGNPFGGGAGGLKRLFKKNAD